MSGIPPGLWREAEERMARLFRDGVYVPANRVMSLGLDAPLRRRCISRLSGVVLDVGCGDGHYHLEMRRRGVEEVVCVDPLPEPRPREAWRHRVVAVAEALPLRDGCVDYAVAFFSYRDFLDRERGLAEMLRVARRGVFVADIFRPEGPLAPLAGFYIGRVAPLLARLVAGGRDYGWRVIGDTVRHMETLREFVERSGGRVVASFLGVLAAVEVPSRAGKAV